MPKTVPKTKHTNVYTAPKGISDSILKEFSTQKNDPPWLFEFRSQALKTFENKDLPTWGPNLSSIDFSDFSYYVKPSASEAKDWKDVDPEIERTFRALGIPAAEQDVLAGVKTQFESDIVYGSLQKELSDIGVIFCSMEEAVEKHGDLVKKYLGTIIPIDDNKFAALNSAFFSGGSFVYVPSGVIVEKPLQTYFRINTKSTGQFERTLIIAEPRSKVNYVEGCTAPNFSSTNLHAAVVEIFVSDNAEVRYTTIQNWSKNVYNLVTKRAEVGKNAKMLWTDANLGSSITMKYPSCILRGDNSFGSLLSLAIAGKKQTIDSGGKMIHLGKNTKSNIISKSLSLNGGTANFRGIVSLERNSVDATAKVNCSALIMDNFSVSNTFPKIVNKSESGTIEHEAFVSKLSEEQLFYLGTRGYSYSQAASYIILGFLEPVLRDIPLEYSLELNKLLEMTMEDYYA
ncbi:MAG: Fe-S cluster assembly protein SufB [candidate division WWE3 bacterium]|nr:Fe-S cluster assembly protein SufB [candidate division WWE3 bacterium]